jgi:hypothetical protein
MTYDQAIHAGYKEQVEWSEGSGIDGERTVSISDGVITSYASVPQGMTMSEAAAEYMSSYDCNGVSGSVYLHCSLWESYSDDDPDDTEAITYDESDLYDIIVDRTADKPAKYDGTSCANGLWIADDDEQKRVFGERGEAAAIAEEISMNAKIDLDAAREYVTDHEDDDEFDDDELEEVFVQVYGRKPDAKDRRDGIWSLICAGV